MPDTSIFLASTARVVSAYVGHNQVIAAEIPNLIRTVFGAMSVVGPEIRPEAPPEALTPAVPVRRSITDDYIICLEDGAKLKTLKRYLRRKFDLTPDAYRARWKLPASYPMVAPAYARLRSDMARKIGLGSRPGAPRRRASGRA